MNIQDVKDVLDHFIQDIKGYTIMEFNGKRLRMNGGNAAWKTPDGARKAFNNSMYRHSRQLGFKNGSEMRKYCEKNGLLKYKTI